MSLSSILHERSEALKMSPRTMKWRRMRLVRDIVLSDDGVYGHLNTLRLLTDDTARELLQGFGNFAPTPMARRRDDYLIASMCRPSTYHRRFIVWTPSPAQLRWFGTRETTIRLEFCFCRDICWGCNDTRYTSILETASDSLDAMLMQRQFGYKSELYGFDTVPHRSIISYMVATNGRSTRFTTGVRKLDSEFEGLLRLISHYDPNPCY